MSDDQPTESSKLVKEKVFEESPGSQYINSWKEILDAPIGLWLLCSIKFFSHISIYTFVSSFSIYITDVRGQSDTYLAQIYAIMGTFAIFSMVFLGNLVDRYGVRQILISGSFLLLLKYTLLLMIQNLWTQRIFFLIPGIVATTLINPTIESGIKHFTGEKYRTLAFSLYFSVTALAALISGIAISLFLIVGDKNQETFDALFIFCAGISCVSLGLSFFSTNFDTEKLPENAIDLEAQKKLSGWEHTKELIILKKFWRLFSVVSIITIIRSVFFQQLMTLSLYMERDLGDDSWYGSMLVLNQTIIIASTPLLSYSVYYFRPYQVFIISGCIAIVAPLFFIIGASYYTICVYVIFSSIGESLLTPRLLEYSFYISPKGKEGTIISITNLPLVFNIMVSGIIGTLLLDEFCPDDAERECWKMWVIIAAIAVPPTLVLVLCEKWITDKEFEANPFIFNKDN